MELYNDPAYQAWRKTRTDLTWIDDQTGRSARLYQQKMDSEQAYKDATAGSSNQPAAPDSPSPTTVQQQSSPRQVSSGSNQQFDYQQPGSGSSGNGIVGPGSGSSSSGWLSELLNRTYVSGGGGSMSVGGGSTGGTGMTSGQIVSVQNNQTTPKVDYTKLIKSLSDGTAKNTANYNKSADAAMKNLNDMFGKVLGLTKGSRDTELANAQEQAAQNAAKTQMGMSMTGLGNSTVMPSLLAQQQRYANLNMNDINQKARNDLANVMLNQIGAQNQLSQEKRQTNLGASPSQTQLLQMMLPLITGSASGGTANLSSLLSMLG